MKLTVRKPQFIPQPQQWFADPDGAGGQGDFMTSWLAAQSCFLPVGERFFIESIRPFRDQVESAEERQEIQDFIGQEGQHSVQHRRLNDAISSSGLPMEELEAVAEQALAWSGRMLRSEKQKLAITVALEHYSAFLAHIYLTDPEIREQLPDDLRQLYDWHALEEIEHKAVAFDVYQKYAPGYFTRATTMTLATLMYFSLTLRAVTIIGASSGRFTRLGVLGAAGRFLVSRRRFWRFLGFVLDYYRPGFHPWQHDDSALARQMEEVLGLNPVAGRGAA